jgi:Dehydroquinase class II
MPKILVIHGAGMNMRGKVQLDVFGPMTLPEYDERIRGYAKELGVEVEIFHSNVEGEIVNKLYAANDAGVDAAIFNPAAFGSGYPAADRGPLPGQVPHDRGAHLEPDPPRAGLTDRRGEPERRGRLRDRRLRARAARHPGPARGEEVAGRAR